MEVAEAGAAAVVQVKGSKKRSAADTSQAARKKHKREKEKKKHKKEKKEKKDKKEKKKKKEKKEKNKGKKRKEDRQQAKAVGQPQQQQQDQQQLQQQQQQPQQPYTDDDGQQQWQQQQQQRQQIEMELHKYCFRPRHVQQQQQWQQEQQQQQQQQESEEQQQQQQQQQQQSEEQQQQQQQRDSDTQHQGSTAAGLTAAHIRAVHAAGRQHRSAAPASDRAARSSKPGVSSQRTQPNGAGVQAGSERWAPVKIQVSDSSSSASSSDSSDSSDEESSGEGAKDSSHGARGANGARPSAAHDAELVAQGGHQGGREGSASWEAPGGTPGGSWGRQEAAVGSPPARAKKQQKALEGTPESGEQRQEAPGGTPASAKKRQEAPDATPASAKKRQEAPDATPASAKKRQEAAAGTPGSSKKRREPPGGTTGPSDANPAQQGNAASPHEQSPQVWQRFEDTPFPEPLKEALRGAGFAAPTPVQAQVWPLAMANRDILAVAQAGTGKTCAYLLPILTKCLATKHTGNQSAQYSPFAVVFCATRELAVQVDEQASFFAATVVVITSAIYGGAPKGAQIEDLISRRPQVLVATIGRLKDLLALKVADGSPLLTLGGTQVVVLDGIAVLQGYGGEPQVTHVLSLTPESRQTIFVTSGPLYDAEQAASSFLRDPVTVNAGEGPSQPKSTDGIPHYAAVLDGPQGKFVLLQRLLQESVPPGTGTLVYCKNNKCCAWVQDHLQKAGFSAVAVHSGQQQSEREFNLAQFREGALSIAVVTDASAKGLDLPGIQCIISYDFAPVMKDFLLRLEHTRTMGGVGAVYTFLTPADAKHAVPLIQILRDTGQFVPSDLEALAGGGNAGGPGAGQR